MADLRDVMDALVALCIGAIIPGGTAGSGHSTLSPVSNAQTRVYPGWPVSAQIDDDVKAEIVNVSIYPTVLARNTTRFLPSWQPVGAVTNGQQTTVNELRRVNRDFQITTWAPTPDIRDSTGAALDLALALADRLPLADGSVAQMRYARDWITDAEAKELIYRRDLVYSVEYGTFQTATSTLVTTVTGNLDGGVSPPDAPIKTITVTQGH